MNADRLNRYLPSSETVAPSDAAAVAEVVRRADESGTAVYPIGGGTSLGYVTRATRPGIGLLLGGLDRLVDHAARDLTITVEAGMTVAQLQETLAGVRQRLPVDVPHADRATVGGAVATAAAGPRRYRWGTIRDYVLGLTAVDGTGTPFSTGGRVVKNAAGYNLCRLMTGSHGTLGVITQVTLMVRPIVECEAWLACAVGDFAMAARLLADMVHTDTLPIAIEWLLGPGDSAGGRAGRLVVGFEGTRAEVDWMLESLAGQWRRAGVDSPALIDKEQSPTFLRSLTDLADQRGVAPGVTVQLSTLPGMVVETAAQILRLVPETLIHAHAGDGIIVARLPVAPDGAVSLVRDRLRPLVAQIRGAMVVLDAPAEAALDATTVWGPPPAAFDTMQAIKRQFDPKNILNPGRFIFGA